MAGEVEEKEEIKLDPKAAIEASGPCRWKVKIEVPAEKITDLIERKYGKLNESVQIPGFRRGHAPRNLLEKRFGKDLLKELQADLVDKGFQEVAEEKDLKPLAEPVLLDAEGLEVKAGAPFAFAVEIETLPTVELKEYKGLKVKKPKIPLEDKEIDAAIEELRDTHAELEPVQDAAADEDRAVLDLELLEGGKSISKQENAAIILAEGVHIHGAPLKEFHKALLGKKTGETAEYRTTLPEDLQEKSLAGTEVTVRATIKGLKRRKLPSLDSEFFKIFDCDDLGELKEEVAKRLKKGKEDEARVRMFADLMLQIMSANDFPVPGSLVERTAQEQMQQAAYNLMEQGAPPEEIRKVLESGREKAQEASRRSLREHMIVDEIAKTEKIFVTEEEVEQEIARMAARMDRDVGELQAEMEQMGVLQGLRRRMRTSKVMDFLLSKAVVEPA